MRKYKNVFKTDEKISEMDVDVFCPCAMGHDITKKNVNKIKAKIIAGTANNQLESLEVGDVLFRKGILQVPDYIARLAASAPTAEPFKSSAIMLRVSPDIKEVHT